MAYYYYKLWDELEKKCLSQQELMNKAKLSNATMQKLRNNESVTVDTLNKIITVLGCDYKDILTSIPPEESEKVDIPSQYCNVIRKVLKDYIKKEQLSVNDIIEKTGLSRNTVKKFLGGGTISSVSIAKLYRLDDKFKLRLNVEIKKLTEGNPKNKKYCDKYGSRKKCLAYRSHWISEKQEYEHYCAFGFNQAVDTEGFTYSLCDCPNPRTMNELMSAQEKYPYEIREKVIFIPAKK